MATTPGGFSRDASSQEHGYHPPRPRRFAPLNPEKANDATPELPKLKGVIFDVDGTLCLPQNYMFKQMREALDIPKSIDILDHIQSLSDEPDQPSSQSTHIEPRADGASQASEASLADAENGTGSHDEQSSPRSRAVAAVKNIERNAMTSQTPQPGLVELMTYLESRNILKGICTRNFPAPVQHLFDKYLSPHGVTFEEEVVITRETKGIQPKPSPEGIWSIARYWATTHGSLGPETVQEPKDGADEDDVLAVARKYLGSGLIMVGDSIDDMAAGYRAGAATVLLLNEDNESLAEHEYTDLAVGRLDELVQVLEEGFVGNFTP